MRLRRALVDFNIGLQSALDFFNSHPELGRVDYNPNCIITDLQYEALKQNFVNVKTIHKETDSMKSEVVKDEETSSKLYRLRTEILDLLQKEDSRLFVDTCTMMHEKFPALLSVLLPALKEYKKKLVIPNSCIEELNKHLKHKVLCKYAQRAKAQLEQIKEYIVIKGNENDGVFADNVFLRVFTQFRMKYTMVLLTQDRNLRADLLALNYNKSVTGKRVHVYHLNNILQVVTKNSITSTFEITSIPDTPVKLKFIPKEGGYVFRANGQKIRLAEDYKAGGEGVVYKIDISNNIVAKVYHDSKLTERKKAKLTNLISKKLSIKGVCLPTELIYNEQKEVIGYLMPLVSGRSLDGTIFKGEKGVTRYFPKWKREDLIDLCINILSSIRILHENGILIGDINGSNILIASPSDFNIVDTDSFQIEGFPCPVGTEDFTAPEIQGKNYGEFLRSEGNENFAIATLLFRMLMFGQKPYAKIESEGVVKDIETGEFSYPYKNKSNNKIPNGNWCFFWSHLHPKIKEAFYLTFKKGERFYGELRRPSVSYWIGLLELYKKNLNDGYLSEVDKESLELFPKTYKKIKGHKYCPCTICGRETDTEYMKDEKYCFECLKGYSEIRCHTCGKKFKYSNYKKYIVQSTTENCPECLTKQKEKEKEARLKRNRKAQIYDQRICSVCGSTFSITEGEAEYLQSRGLSMPKRCEECRALNLRPISTYDPPKSSEAKDSGFCYITTAVCNYYGKPDNCVELNKLRSFRDNWLMKQENGLTDISIYYDYAPEVVDKLLQSPDYAETCEEVMRKFITPCVNLIDLGKYEECRNKYFELFRFMIKKYK